MGVIFRIEVRGGHLTPLWIKPKTLRHILYGADNSANSLAA